MNPLTIYQQALDTVSAAALAGDFAAYAAMIDLPYLVHTDVARLLVTSRADLLPTFQTLHQTLRRRGVTHYERLAREADYVAPHRIEGRHFTHMIADGIRVAPPHQARQVLVLRTDVWRFSEAHYATEAATWPVPEHLLFPAPKSDARG
ncbi:MAG: hypothetical protein C0524_00255 [Rhodobacter sp.]|nr:hypothetical protein [Rhodobacter sp.]